MGCGLQADLTPVLRKYSVRSLSGILLQPIFVVQPAENRRRSDATTGGSLCRCGPTGMVAWDGSGIPGRSEV